MKILNLEIVKCQECPYYHTGCDDGAYGSGYTYYECKKANDPRGWKGRYIVEFGAGAPAVIPEWCPLPNKVYKENEKPVFLKVGDIIYLDKEHVVYGKLKEKLVYSNKRNSNKIIRTEVHLKDFPIFCGKYVVVKTSFEGGDPDPRDPYPNGHHVYCQKLSDGLEVDFYQSGCFSAMIKNIDVIGRAKNKWIIEEE